jgi:hypothetical protein
MSFAGDIVVQPAAPVVGSQLDEIYRQMLEVSATATDAVLSGGDRVRRRARAAQGF